MYGTCCRWCEQKLEALKPSRSKSVHYGDGFTKLEFSVSEVSPQLESVCGGAPCPGTKKSPSYLQLLYLRACHHRSSYCKLALTHVLQQQLYSARTVHGTQAGITEVVLVARPTVIVISTSGLYLKVVAQYFRAVSQIAQSGRTVLSPGCGVAIRLCGHESGRSCSVQEAPRDKPKAAVVQA